ncbi:MAG: hypothetical protein ACLTV6_07710 [Christensenellales bacterium]
MSAGFGEVPKVEIDGVTYEQKMDVTSLLMIGIDKASTDEIRGTATAASRISCCCWC